MQEKEDDRENEIEMRHEKTTLKDGRYMIFYEFDDLNSNSKMPKPEGTEKSEDT